MTARPVVSVDGCSVRNGSEATNRTIGGAIEAARPNDLGNVTVTVEGGPSIEVQPGNSTVPASNVTFVANVSFEDRNQRIRATLADTTNRKHGRGPPKHANGQSSSDSSPTTDELLLDGDALPDTYELETAGTDPLDPDSDSSKTAVDESDNGTLDGLVDFDGDTVTTYHEGLFGTDPFSGDTDGDRLPDRYEITYTKLDQTRADTNDDGVTDDAWDIDNDSLTTYEEYEAGTTPTQADEDRDELDDDRELEVGTNSSDPDTDDDGLLDGEELALGTDPLVADSDGDGVLDGNATYTTETSNESLGVNVSLAGNGEIASGVSIRNGSQERFESDSIESAQVTPFVDLESGESFESANVTFSYDGSQLGETNESNLVVFRYNESLGVFEPLNTTVDAESNTVTGETEHFSRFVVFDVRNWASNFVADRPEDVPDESEVQPVDVTMIIDTSGSMSWNDPQEFRKQAAKEFVGALVEEDRAGVVDFDHNAHVAQELTTDFGKVNLTIESLDASGSTDIGDGVREANQHFAEASNESRAQAAILLTDGRGSGGRAEARTAARRNTTIYTIGFGGANGNKLQDIARITGGNYTYVDNPSDLPNVFSRVAEDIGAQDTDGDGISDAAEHRGVVTARAGMLETDPYSADTDGDGLEDGSELGEAITAEELRERNFDGSGPPGPDPQYQAIAGTVSRAGYNLSELSGSIYIDPVSDPSRVHTDGDGVDDYTESEDKSTVVRTTSVSATREAKEGSSAEGLASAYVTDGKSSDPWQTDSDGDGLDDARERELATNPIATDTDGDGIEDSDEVEGAGDPTLYDDRPPEIEVIDSGQDVSKNGVRYWAYVRLHDPAGIGYATLVKDGNKEGKKPFYSDGTIVTTLDFTEGFAESETDIDRSSWKSTAISVGSKGLETIGSAAGTAGDISAGTRVYVEANDRNENRGRVVALQQPNAYSEIIGFTAGSPIDPFIARHAGTLSGFSTSVGVPLQDVSQLIDDPRSFTEGIKKLLKLIKEEQIAAPVTLVKVMVQDAQQKQALNNPYDKDEHPRAYKLFRDNWYAGFAGGFFALTYGTGGASAGAKSAVKTTKSAQKVSSKLADTKTLRALSRISDAKKAAKGRAVARILMTVDGNAPEPLLSSADTAGGAYKLWRHQRGMDADVDSLPESKQERLGQLLLQTGDDGVAVTNALDQETLNDFLSIRRTATPDGGRDVRDLSRAVIVRESRDLSDAELQSRVRQIVDTYEKLDTQRAKDELADVIESSGESGIYLAENVDATRIFELVDQGIDLKRHAEGLDDYRKIDKSAGDSGELAELFAQERIFQQEFDQSETVYPPRNVDTTRIDIFNSNGRRIAEFDGMTTDGDGVRRIVEVKKSPEKARTAREQMRDSIDNIHDNTVDSGTSFRLDQRVDFSSLGEKDISLITVGPSDAKRLDTPQSHYDYYLEFTQNELKELSDTIQSEGL